MELWQLLYFITGILSGLIAYKFFRSKNGMLRKVMIAYFGSIAFGTTVRGASGFMDTAKWEQWGSVVFLLSIGLVVSMTFILLYYIHVNGVHNGDKS